MGNSDRQKDGTGMSLPSYQSTAIASSRHQLLEIARGLMYMHSLGIAHGNLKIVRLLLSQQP